MKRLGSVLAIILFTILAVPTVVPAAEGGSPAAADLAPLLRDSGGAARVSLHPATGAARFVRLPARALLLDGADTTARAGDFLRRYGSTFKIQDPAAELSEPVTRTDRLGRARVSYRQVYRGLPVFAGRIHLHFDKERLLAAVNGTFVPGISVDTQPALTRERAEALAIADVRKRFGSAHPSPLEAADARLLVFRAGLVQRVPGRDHLVYEVEVGNGPDVREFVYVDAHDGRIVDRITGIHTAVDRRIHEPRFNDVVIWSEGDALPYSTSDTTNDDQVNGLIDVSADVYAVYSNLSAGTYLSWNGLDDTMHTVWKAETIQCPNATWNGSTTNFCDGVASDDVAAHEWAHGYTQATHGLIYQWQPGALNEAYSDIFGELIDLLNGAGTDTPDLTRSEGDCSVYAGSPPPDFVINAPPALAGPYAVGGAGFNPAPPLSATAQVELVDDGDDEGGAASVSDACQPLIGFTPGNIALIDRGTCTFASKVLRAQDAGAVAAIIANSDDSVSFMGGSDPSITIPSVMLSSSDSDQVKLLLAGGVSATITLPEATADSYRWLVGEDAFSFGGPIRDMWTPTCKGDPGKVSDPNYWCDSGDGGGVHTNSGVPNHAFALLVDGGSFNGRSVGALGPIKAAHVYWRAMSVYQVPDTDFADHADALAQSCADLLGVDLPDLLTGAPSGETITVGDCDQITEAMLAVEISQDPPCEFTPVLSPDPPLFVCGTATLFDDFEQDPAGSWALGNEGVYAEYVPRDWEWTASLPEGGAGSAFFALNSAQIGNCVPGDDDQSGKMYLDSPLIDLDAAGSVAFDHWVGTEPAYDGGNVKVSVNDGPFQLVDVGDFTFNPYNGALVTADGGNTNPLAGEAAFTGSDGGSVSGSWGQSQIDLGAYAGSGDTLRLRFELGVDGCNGLYGWYLDNVLVCSSAVSAGQIPNGESGLGMPLSATKAQGTEITLNWSASCHVADSDYEIYEGTIGDFGSYRWKYCSTGGATAMTFDPGPDSVFYLVVPSNLDREGSYGTDGDGIERSQGAPACLAQSITTTCP